MNHYRPGATPLLVALVVVLLASGSTPSAARPAPALHDVRVGVSTWPATVTAQWRDQAGGVHELDPWADRPVRVPARSVVVAVVAGDEPVQCTVTVDGATVDTATARGGVAVCSWAG